MKRHIPVLVIALLFITSILSCKKDITANEPSTPAEQNIVKKLKEWYNAQTPIQINYSTPSLKDEIPLNPRIGEPLWDKTTYSETDQVSITPIITSSKTGTKTPKYLVVEYKNSNIVNGHIYYLVVNKNKSKVVPEIKPDILKATQIPEFTGAIIKYDLNGTLILSRHFENGMVDKSKSDKMVDKITIKGDGNTSNTAPENCYIIDHWWVVWDQTTGQIYSIEHEGSTEICTGGGGGNGNGGGNGCSMTEGEADNALNAISVYPEYLVSHQQGSTSTDQNGVKRKPKNSKWKFLSLTLFPGYTPEYSANFTGVISQQTNTDPWKWEQFSYSSTYQTGGTIPQCFDVHMNTTVSAAIAGDNLSANATLNGNAIVTINCMIGLKAAQYNISSMTCNFLAQSGGATVE